METSVAFAHAVARVVVAVGIATIATMAVHWIVCAQQAKVASVTLKHVDCSGLAWFLRPGSVHCSVTARPYSTYHVR